MNKELKEEMSIEEIVAQNIRHYRKSKNLSQESLAAALGISWQQISNYENSKNIVSISRLYEISLFLEVPFVRFFSKNDQKFKNNLIIDASSI